MKWNNASLDEPPGNGETVLVSVNGIYYLATYNSQHGSFVLIDEPETYFSPSEHLIYWAPFTSES